MGFIESMAMLVALAGGAYVTVYYVLPALQQMSIAPYYYMQQAAAAAQQQQPAPATTPPAQEPVTQDATLTDEALEPEPEPEAEAEEPSAATGDELEDAGLVSEPPAEAEEEKKKEKKASSDSSSAKKANEAQKKRHNKTVKSMDPKKDSRYKGMTSKQAGQAAKKKLLGRYTQVTPSGEIKVMFLDEYDIVREQYYT